MPPDFQAIHITFDGGSILLSDFVEIAQYIQQRYGDRKPSVYVVSQTPKPETVQVECPVCHSPINI